MTTFGISTTVFGEAPAGAREFDLIASHGFSLVELAAGPGRFDAGNATTVKETRALLSAAALEVAGLSVALADALAAIDAAAELASPLLVARAEGCLAHGPVSRSSVVDAGALRRAIETLADRAAGRGVALAVEFPTRMVADDIVATIESLDCAPFGVCLDIGHANLTAGGAPEAIEILSGYILTTHLHDNRGGEDSHRPPYAGTVDWPLTLMALWKTGYVGSGILEVAAEGDVSAALARAVSARTRLQAILDDLAQPMVFPE